MNDEPSRASRPGLDVFRFVVEDEPDAGDLREATRAASAAAKARPQRFAAWLRATEGAMQAAERSVQAVVVEAASQASSRAQGAASAWRRALGPLALGAAGAVAAIGVLFAARYVVTQRPAAVAPPQALPTRAAVAPIVVAPLSRDQRIHLAAEDLVSTAVDRTPNAAPPFNGYLYDLPRSRAFAQAWQGVVSRLPVQVRASNQWLVSLETTAAPNETIESRSGVRYVLAWGCDPNACAARTVHLVYNVATSSVAATVALDHSRRTLGSNAVDDRATLLAELACERLGLPERFPLAPLDAQKAERVIAATPLE